jgi:hypothetical protein
MIMLIKYRNSGCLWSSLDVPKRLLGDVQSCVHGEAGGGVSNTHLIFLWWIALFFITKQ